MKLLFASSSVVIAAGAITKQDWLFILGLVGTVINAVIEYLRYRQEKKNEHSSNATHKG